MDKTTVRIHNEIPDLLKPAFHVDRPWDVIAAYPEAAWKALKIIHDENIQLKEEIAQMQSAAKVTEVIQNCGENRCRVDK